MIEFAWGDKTSGVKIVITKHIYITECSCYMFCICNFCLNVVFIVILEIIWIINLFHPQLRIMTQDAMETMMSKG